MANAQLHLEAAYRKFFREAKAGYPRYKSKRHHKQSYTTNVVGSNIRLEGKRLRLPKAGKVKIVLHRQIPQGAILKSVTITREASGKYYASVLCELPEPENQRCEVSAKDAKILGVDYAMQGMGVFSDGTKAEYPGYYRKAQERLAREQRKLSHCEKGSRNYEKQRKRVAVCHEKIRHQREDYQHKMTRKLADGFDAVAVEDLDMKALSQCLHLGKGIMDNAYGAFLQKLSSCETFCPHFHLSLQSGCDRTLQRMNRHYSAKEFLSAVRLIREYFPDAAITTDVIVGFPGESREDFEESMRMVSEAAFSELHVFPFSRRKGTKADQMPDQLTRAEKENLIFGALRDSHINVKNGKEGFPK